MNRIITELLQRYVMLEPCNGDIVKAYDMLVCCYENGGKLLACGNGGSAADADHIVGELMKGFLKKRPLSDEDKSRFADCSLADGLQYGLPAISLAAHGALMTAFANDEGADSVFAQQVFAYSRACKSDVLLALTTSGNSSNVVKAVQAANACGIGSIAITGKKESAASAAATVCIRLPETETFKIQELTLPVYHALCAAVEEHFYTK